ncbi:MAG: amidophosphoribosyltransferase [Kiritimatiellaeota bacterium]|nr:amidophosphoribosyltransferase [Kiritimatiellota bacterium]
MSGFFGVASKEECWEDLFYGTDYHSHLGTRRGGLVTFGNEGFRRHIHDISNAQFRSKFSNTIREMKGHSGIGIISDYEDQPLIIGSHLGTYAIVTVGVINNMEELTALAYRNRRAHFSNMDDGVVNPTELVAALINLGASFAEGIRLAQEAIDGSCSLLLLTEEGIYAARDAYGRTPIVLGQKEEAFAAAFESCALPNTGYLPLRDMGPGEIVRLTAEGAQTVRPADGDERACLFLWIYYGFPASAYNGVNVEESRYRSGRLLAQKDTAKADMVMGVPDSGVGHALGYANASGIPYGRPLVKYTPTWARSFMPPDQSAREKVARMKLLPIPQIIGGKRIVFLDDSIVRGTQLRDMGAMLFRYGAKELHARIACPPLLFGCRFLNFSRSTSVMELVARRMMKELSGNKDDATACRFANPDSSEYAAMVQRIGAWLRLTSLQYQQLGDMVAAVGLPKHRLCTYCWDGTEGGSACGGCCTPTTATPMA